MEPLRKGHRIELSSMPDEATGYTQLEAATVNHLHAPVTALMFDCSGTQVCDPEVRDEGSGQP